MSQQYVKDEYPLSDVTARIIAAAKEVRRTLGPGFEEVIYQLALAVELPAHDLEFSREVWMDVTYKGVKVGRKRVDFLIDESKRSNTLAKVMNSLGNGATPSRRGHLWPEICCQTFARVDFVQALSYLKASGYKGRAPAQLWGQQAAD